jgi:hypothetical protein
LSFSILIVARCRPQAVARERSSPDLVPTYVVDTVSDFISVDPQAIRPVPVDPRVPNNADTAKARLNTAASNIPPILLSFIYHNE